MDNQYYSADDFVPGSEGTSYFLAVLRTMTKNQTLIESFFSTKEINKAGIYVVFYYINGIRTSVIIDDFVPCILNEDGTFRPAFIHSPTQLIWAILLEKAWAKLCGNYDRIIHDHAGFLRSHITGIPYKYFIHK